MRARRGSHLPKSPTGLRTHVSHKVRPNQDSNSTMRISSNASLSLFFFFYLRTVTPYEVQTDTKSFCLTLLLLCSFVHSVFLRCFAIFQIDFQPVFRRPFYSAFSLCLCIPIWVNKIVVSDHQHKKMRWEKWIETMDFILCWPNEMRSHKRSLRKKRLLNYAMTSNIYSIWIKITNYNLQSDFPQDK